MLGWMGGRVRSKSERLGEMVGVRKMDETIKIALSIPVAPVVPTAS